MPKPRLVAEAEHQILSSLNSTQVGPEAKEYNLLRADEEYRNGNSKHSIFYQVRAQLHATDTRYITTALKENQKLQTIDLLREDKDLASDCKNNAFFGNILHYLQQKEQQEAPAQLSVEQPMEKLDFLENITQPTDGLARIADICQQLPHEWSVIHICKSFNAATTYSVFEEIFSAEGAIYIALLRHCRTPELAPTCLRLSNDILAELFKEYGTIIERFKRIIHIDIKIVKTQAAKQKYWKELNEFEVFLQALLYKFRKSIAPFAFLFHGKRYSGSAVQQQTTEIYRRVDALCKELGWSAHQKILLSQAALNANELSDSAMQLASFEIAANNYKETEMAYDLLKRCAADWQETEQREDLSAKRYPTILVVDERLDHFHWEQLLLGQEFTRVKSLHCLWRLYKFHKPHIKHGFYTVNITKGMSIINPDADLPNSGRRLRSFLEYWLPHWRHLFETVPTECIMLHEAFKADCFIYAGHGSGLQYISAKVISKALVKSVVFLFGCDSTRLMSTGLYSALYGAHNYYHGALCPTLVGTLMPALDANIDTVLATVLSHWLSPGSEKTKPWTYMDRHAWVTKGEIKERTEDAQISQGSLCSLLANVQKGLVEPKIYNCCVYVNRGLPAWNLAVQKMPF